MVSTIGPIFYARRLCSIMDTFCNDWPIISRPIWLLRQFAEAESTILVLSLMMDGGEENLSFKWRTHYINKGIQIRQTALTTMKSMV